jgi:hypothetical protein
LIYKTHCFHLQEVVNNIQTILHSIATTVGSVEKENGALVDYDTKN